MRSFVISTFMLAVAFAPAVAAAQPPAGQQPPAQGQPPATQQPTGQQPTAQPPAQQQQQPSTARTFSSDAGMLFNMIKPDHTADFEMVMNRVKEALAKSADPIRKQQAASWKLFKSVEPGMPLGDGTRAVLYISYVDPAVKDADYTTTKILAEAFPSEVQELYNKLVACYPPTGGQSIVNLQLITTMGGGAPAGGGK